MAPTGAIFGELIGSIRTCKLQLGSDQHHLTQLLLLSSMVDLHHQQNRIRHGKVLDRNPLQNGQSASRYR